MSDRPKTPQPEKGQVTSLTQHRAERNGQFVPSIYDTPYRKGERINCDDPSIAYTVRVGRIRVQKEIDTRGGRRLVTVDFLDKDEPLLVNRFIASIKDDHDLQFYADTDVVIGEFPIPALGPLFGRPEFQAQFAAIAARHVQSSRKALYGQLVRYQEKLEELEEAKRLVESTQRKLDEIADENIGLQLKVLGTESENAELKKALASSLSKQETLRRSNQNLCASQQTMRDTHVEEIERIAKLSKERYAELRERRDRDKRRERLRWRAVENLLARLGNPLLLPDEIQDLLGVDAQTDSADLPDADVPTITIEEAEAGIDIEAILIAEEAEDAERSDTLIPPWDGSVTMSSLSAEQPPASCPRPAFLPAPRAPLLSATMPCPEYSRRQPVSARQSWRPFRCRPDRLCRRQRPNRRISTKAAGVGPTTDRFSRPKNQKVRPSAVRPRGSIRTTTRSRPRPKPGT
jgi:hypothetical protein